MVGKVVWLWGYNFDMIIVEFEIYFVNIEELRLFF